MAVQVALACSVLVDAMGSFSPIAAQARRGRKPDSVVLMVGSCSQGLPSRPGADLLYSFVPLNKSVLQLPLCLMVKDSPSNQQSLHCKSKPPEVHLCADNDIAGLNRLSSRWFQAKSVS